MKEKVNACFEKLSNLFHQLDTDDKARFLNGCDLLLKQDFNIDASKQILFSGIEELVVTSKKKRWKRSYVIITINSYERDDIERVLKEVLSYCDENDIEVEQLNAGRDFSDSYTEIAMKLRNEWTEYKLILNKYIDQSEFFDFLQKFPEIRIES